MTISIPDFVILEARSAPIRTCKASAAIDEGDFVYESSTNIVTKCAADTDAPIGVAIYSCAANDMVSIIGQGAKVAWADTSAAGTIVAGSKVYLDADVIPQLSQSDPTNGWLVGVVVATTALDYITVELYFDPQGSAA